MFQTFQTSIQEATLPDQPLAMPPPSPPVPSMTPPTPTNESPPPPDPPSAPSDIHESCVPLTIFKGLEADYEALERRLKSVQAENRILKQSADYYRGLVHEQRDGKVPKRTSDIIFKKRLEPFVTETRAHVMVNNLKRPRQWAAEDLNAAGEILSHVSKKGFDIVQKHTGGPCRDTVKRGFSWLSIMPGIIKPIGRV